MFKMLNFADVKLIEIVNDLLNVHKFDCDGTFTNKNLVYGLTCETY